MSANLALLLLSAAPLTIDAAVERALSVAPELSAQRKAEEAAAAQVGEAFSGYFPRLSLDAAYLFKYPKNELPIEIAIPGVPPVEDIDDLHHFQGGLKLGYRFFDLSREHLIDAAEAKEEAEKQGTKELAARLAFRVRAIYLAALFARDLERIASESLKVALEEERRAVLAAEVGTGTRVALAQARVRVASLRSQKRRAESELLRHQDSLGSLLELEEVPPLEGELEKLAGPVFGLDIEAHPELLRLDASRRAADSAGKARSWTLIPTLSAQASVELQYPRALALEWGPVYQVGIGLSWPFFDGLARERGAEAQHAIAAQLGELSEAKKQELERKLIDLRARTRTANAELESARETLSETELYLKVARAALEAGTGTELDVHNAELGIDRARIDVQRALLELAAVRAEALMVYGVAEESNG
jgi:outer membrane protein TolC